MSDPRVLPNRSKVTSLAVGLLLGVLLGFATSLVFLLIVIGPLLGLGLAIAGLRGGLDGRPRTNVGGGLLIGMGSVYLLGSLNTLNSCQGQDVCGGASALPFLGFAVVVLALGLLVEGITFTRDQRESGPWRAMLAAAATGLLVASIAVGLLVFRADQTINPAVQATPLPAGTFTADVVRTGDGVRGLGHVVMPAGGLAQLCQTEPQPTIAYPPPERNRRLPVQQSLSL